MKIQTFFEMLDLNSDLMVMNFLWLW
jgi:hypothetical protein